jgi:hypothetical protein
MGVGFFLFSASNPNTFLLRLYFLSGWFARRDKDLEAKATLLSYFFVLVALLSVSCFSASCKLWPFRASLI